MTQACLSKNRPLGRAALAAGLFGLSLLASTARADEPSKADVERARALFQEGVALASANNCAGALQKYKAVVQVKMTPQVAFNIGECEERMGRLVEALGNYRLAASLASEDKRASQVLEAVGKRIDVVEARIPKLTLTRGKGADAASIELDGTEVGQAQLGSAMPVNPGPHTVIARVEGKEYLHETVTLQEKEAKTVDIKLDVPPPQLAQGGPVRGPVVEPPPRSRVPGIVVTAAGGVALVTGLIAVGLRQGAIGTLNGLCNADNQCHDTPDARSAERTGKTMTGLAEVMIPVGVAGAAVGVFLLVTSGPPKAKLSDDKKKTSLAPSIELRGGAPGGAIGGASVAGRF